MTHYQAAWAGFKAWCPDMTPDEEERARIAFDKTLVAAQARFLDALHEFGVALADSLPAWARRLPW